MSIIKRILLIIFIMCACGVSNGSMNPHQMKGHKIDTELSEFLMEELPDCHNIARGAAFIGGGVRGLLQGCIVAKIEDATGKPIMDTIHMSAGTSTGGIQAVALSCNPSLLPVYDAHGKPRKGDESLESVDPGLHYDSKFVKSIYRDDATTIFPRECCGVYNNVRRVVSTKYSDSGINKVLYRYLKNIPYSRLRGDLVVTYVSDRYGPSFAKTHQIRHGYAPDFLARDIAAATSAAPTYLPPHKMQSISSNHKAKPETITAMDGGLAANDPSKCLLTEMFKAYSKADAYFLMTIGTGYAESFKHAPTGLLSSAVYLPDAIMSNSTRMTRYFIKHDGPMYAKPVIYCYLDVEIPEAYAEMDNTEPDNLLMLESLANNDEIDGKICNIASFLATPKVDVDVIATWPNFKGRSTRHTEVTKDECYSSVDTETLVQNTTLRQGEEAGMTHDNLAYLEEDRANRGALTEEMIDAMTDEEKTRRLKEAVRLDIRNKFFEVFPAEINNGSSNPLKLNSRDKVLTRFRSELPSIPEKSVEHDA